MLPKEGELRGSRGVTKLEPKVMRLLLCLANQAGRAVDRETLIDTVWDGRAISDEALFRCVAELRKKLGDSSSAPEYVQTVHKIGYRLIAPVDRLEQSLSGRSPEPAATPSTETEAAVPGWAFPLKLDGLEILRLLGSGSMANVHLAREPALERLVAVKTFLADANADDNARRRLLREARAAARLVHPNVTTVYRVGELADGVPYIVQQYIDGPNLAELIEVEGPMNPRRALRHLRQLASALAAAHAKRIVHRDVKPANILIDSNDDRAFLSDFGLAGLQETGRGEPTRLTLAGELLGDPRFISPEQARGESVTPVCDVYSLGIVAALLLTGRYPYDESGETDPISLHLRATPRMLNTLRPDLSEEIARIVHRCLEKEPRRRPSAEQLVRLLESEIGDEATGTAVQDRNIPADIDGESPRSFRRRLQIGIAVLAIVTMAAAVWFGTN